MAGADRHGCGARRRHGVRWQRQHGTRPTREAAVRGQSGDLHHRRRDHANALATGGGAVDAFSITPDLPTGLVFDAGSGRITGTPSVVTPQPMHTVTTTNAAGSATLGLTITVDDVAPNIACASGSYTFVGG